jgi:hypothetical protein
MVIILSLKCKMIPNSFMVLVLRMRLCPQAQFFSPKNIKTYLSRPKIGTFGGLAGAALSRGQDIPEHWKNIVSHIVSFLPLNYSPSVLAVLVVVMLVVVLLLCCCCCLHLLHCRVANTAATTAAATATVGTPPPLPPLSVGAEVDIISLFGPLN